MISLQNLTVGQVSGMIAAAVFLVQFLVPIALPVILLGLLKPRSSAVTETATSWSVIGRFFHSSLWPLFLRTDSAATSSACRPAVFISFFKTFILLLIAVAAVVTPLGLYEGIVAEPTSDAPTFHYIKDTSAMGFGTPPRDVNNAWSRLCGAFLLVPCPNDNNKATVVDNNSMISVDYQDDVYSSVVPQKLVDAFQSGTDAFNESVSSSFDIQYRSYIKHVISDMKTKGPSVDNGTARTVGNYQPLSSILLNDAIMPVEGLIVDLKDGGIGFRNHTAPTWQTYGSTWTEDLLFIVPETVCVDTNLTVDFLIPRTDSEQRKAKIGVYKPVITDRGGFVNLNRTYPKWDIGDVQENPNLWYRAYRAAWLRNAYSMAYMNVTSMTNETLGTKAFAYLNSSLNKTFPLYFTTNETATGMSINPQSLSVASNFGNYFVGTEGLSNVSTFGNQTTQYSFDSKLPIYANPFNINSSSWSAIDTLCRGQGGADLANITNIMAKCGVLNGAPRRKGDSSSVLFDPGSEWSIPMYTCVSTTKAIIKTVSFRYNGTTDDLSSLRVVSLADKTYANDAAKPLWGVENTSMFLKDGSPLWGLVSASAAQTMNLSTVRKEALYLPGRDPVMGWQNLPGADFAGLALDMAYSTGSMSKGVDYSGQTNLAMFRKWQQLSQNPSTSAQILNLIWTDIAANMVVGTKSLEPKNAGGKTTKRDDGNQKKASSSANKTPPITNYTRRVKYHYAYGIPAFITLALASLSFAFTLFYMLFAGATPSTIRTYLQHTSTGRLLTSQAQAALAYGTAYEARTQTVRDSVYSNAPTQVWVKGVGREKFTLGAEGWSRNVRRGSGRGRGRGRYAEEKSGKVDVRYELVPGGGGGGE